MKQFDIVLLTASKFLDIEPGNWYTDNVQLEDDLLTDALTRQGLKVTRTNWDNKDFDWNSAQFALFRACWDYFDRYTDFVSFMQEIKHQIPLINAHEIIQWNLDKQYLFDLKDAGINVPPSVHIKPKDTRSLKEICSETKWGGFILKPTFSGGGRHTYLFNHDQIDAHEDIFSKLIVEESMLLQEYQRQITTKGEISLMVFGGQFTHAILKKAKSGDFRVQDDYGGTVHPYLANSDEITFAERVIQSCGFSPDYARVDVMWDNEDQLCLAEMELFEPELWFRNLPESADVLAKHIKDKYFS